MVVWFVVGHDSAVPGVLEGCGAGGARSRFLVELLVDERPACLARLPELARQRRVEEMDAAALEVLGQGRQRRHAARDI